MTGCQIVQSVYLNCLCASIDNKIKGCAVASREQRWIVVHCDWIDVWAHPTIIFELYGKLRSLIVIEVVLIDLVAWLGVDPFDFLNSLCHDEAVELDAEQIVHIHTIWHLVVIIGLDLAGQSLLWRWHGPGIALICIQWVVKDVLMGGCVAPAEQNLVDAQCNTASTKQE